MSKDADDFEWPDITKMTDEEVRQELLEQRKRYEVMEKDLFKAQTETRKTEKSLKQLQELQSKHGVTHNNTSSAFTLPSEFKKLWDELVTELILDAFPDFLDQYQQFVCLVQELFIVVRQLIQDTKTEMVLKVAIQLNLIESGKKLADLKSEKEETKQVLIMLEQKLQGVFKDYNTEIFDYTDS